jgi:membrane fusion protein, multidrug efflux system
MKRAKSLIVAFAIGIAWAQGIGLVSVVSKPISRTIDLPGEFVAFQSVAIHAKVRGYVERMLVDRGSVVRRGDLLAELTAPEMQAQIAEAESKVQAVESERLQAVAQWAAAESTADRLKQASETPGAIAANELIQAQKQVEAAKALIESRQQSVRAAEAVVRAQKDLQSYLRITAPFDGVVTDRLVHPGALAGPGSGSDGDPALLVIQDVTHLRLVVALPEEDVGGIMSGARVDFRVPAYPDRTYTGAVARISHVLDVKTRTMAVEMDVLNRDGSLSPGMYPSVKWPIRESRSLLLVPKTSVVITTERMFVIRDRNGRAEWIDIRKGTADGDLVEVAGDLKVGDLVVQRANDEIREGDTIRTTTKKKP